MLDDATIGEDSFVAAGSLVTPGTVIPPRSMVMGSPARVRREVTEQEIASYRPALEELYRIQEHLSVRGCRKAEY